MALITLIAVLITLEIWFRLRPDTIPEGACRSSHVLNAGYCWWFFEYDNPPRFGHIYKPGYSYEGPFNPADPAVVGAEKETCPTGRDDTFQYSFYVDDLGFVNPTPWASEYDIVISGDSFTQSFAPVWWIDLLREQTGMSILNLGVGGWGTLSEVEAIRAYGLDKNPKWVVLLYFEGNDLFNVGQYDERRKAGTDWRTYQLRQAKPLERMVMPHLLQYWASLITDAGTDVPPQSGECHYPMTVYTNYGSFQTIFSDELIEQLSWSREQIESSGAWQLATQAILELRRETETQGGRFLLVYVPAKEHLYWGLLWDEVDVAHFLERTNPRLSFKEYSETVDAQASLMGEFTATSGIEFLDLTGAFWLGTRENGELYNFADSHWNSEGNHLAAQLIAEHILSNP